jgi:hypothetical protein
MELGDYNKVEITHTNTLNKELRECFEELIEIKDKIKNAFEDYQSKISLNKDQPAQDPCIKCSDKPVCEFKNLIESYDEIRTGEFVSNWDGSVFTKELMFGGNFCGHKLRAELLNAIKKEAREDEFVTYAVNQTIKALTDTPSEFNPFPFYWPND